MVLYILIKIALDVTYRYYCPALFDKFVGSFKSPVKCPYPRRRKGLTISRLLEQKQHLLLNYFKTPSVGPAGN